MVFTVRELLVRELVRIPSDGKYRNMFYLVFILVCYIFLCACIWAVKIQWFVVFPVSVRKRTACGGDVREYRVIEKKRNILYLVLLLLCSHCRYICG